MSDSGSNIEFNYLYRDAGNNKVYGSEIFTNPEALDLSVIEAQILAALIDHELFDPSDWKVKRLKHDDWVPELDHSWNEYRSVEFTDEQPTQSQSISAFLAFIATVKKPW